MRLFGLLGLLVIRATTHHGEVTLLAPVDDQSLTDKEKHDGDLGDGEEAPDGGLLHEVVGDGGGKHGTEQEQETALEDHALLLVQSKERSKHQERVDTSAHHEVRRVSHGDRPAKVSHGLRLEGAQVLTSQPLSGRVGLRDLHLVERGHVCQEVSGEQKKTTNQTKTLDNDVSIDVLLTLSQTGVDHVAVIRLQADV